MGLFNKKKEEKGIPELPSLPKLPELPELPNLPNTPTLKAPPENSSLKEIHQLPSFPSDSLSTKFSQNTIKDAVSGQKEDEEEEVNDFELPTEVPMMQPPLKRIPLAQPITETPMPQQRMTKEAEPVFIRIDKFEDALNVFNEAKHQITKIERLLDQTKEIKEREEHELQEWTKDIQQIKSQIEKVDKDIFSKI